MPMDPAVLPLVLSEQSVLPPLDVLLLSTALADVTRDPVSAVSISRPAVVIRGHFCPSVTATVARVNRAKRRSANLCRALAKTACIPRGPVMPPAYSLPAEYVDLLKATYSGRSFYGGPDYTCNKCCALFWYQECVIYQSSCMQGHIVYNLCCPGGRVSLPPHKPFPPLLRSLIRFSGHPRPSSFMRLIRHYNSLFTFTSLGINVDKSINTGASPYVFHINGVVHHRIGSLLPSTGCHPKFAQLYVYDTSNELQNRLNLFDSDGPYTEQPDPAIVEGIIAMLNTYNPIVQQFRLARDSITVA